MLDGNIKVPRGIQMGVPMHSIHFDEEFYTDAGRFDPFRFSDSIEQRNQAAAGLSTAKKKTLVALDDTFLMFGYGKNSCPGRFFAAHLMKLIMAPIIQNYDVEFMETRPAIQTLMEFRFPSESTTIRVRRRGNL
jgi:cytochrome P450